MSTIGMFSIYDSKANEYLQPFYAKNYESAKRYLVSSLKSDSLLVQYPSDYDFYFLGDFDNETGSLRPELVRLASLRELVPDSLRQYSLDGSFKD